MSGENRDVSVRHRDGWCLVRSGDQRVVLTSCDLSVTLRFGDAINSAPFPSVVVVFKLEVPR